MARTRTILLATLQRRQGMSFQVKTAGYQVIGTMTLNPTTARHEMEITEEDFLRHSKELARLCAVPGLGWYVAEFREKDASPYTKGVQMDELKGVPFFTLRKIAKDLGLDASDPKLKGHLKEAIIIARNGAAIQQLEQKVA